ncbi:D-glycero-beta-D-manno-heptose 1-phosphate adenylyltransferase [Candidatus Woesearchaeota archaeon]|nr:D-glycero-beta-D-manno-heptose 1-phosphate adenylyltransferase [Candidatus Woesearchaeota archaeon]
MSKDKIVSRQEIISIRKQMKEQGKTVVFTNGCFDILHAWHVKYLEETKKNGDVLILGINSDRSVKELKGLDRPIVDQDERAEVVAGLEAVDYVVIFDEKTPEKLIEELRPDFYTKGGDYTIDTINQDERKLLEGLGIRIVIVKGDSSYSTTNMIQKILKTHQEK